MKSEFRIQTDTPIRAEMAASVADPFFAEALFDRVPNVVFFVKNLRGEYVVVNDTLVARCGLRSKSELIGRTARDVFPEPLGSSYFEQDRLVVASRAEIRDRLELHFYADRTRGWCVTHKYPLRGRDGAVIGMTGLSRDLHGPDESRAGYRGLSAALDYLGAHVAEPLRVEDLATVARMPVRRFHRLAKRVFGLTPGQLVSKARIDEATRLLAETDRSISDVALACGYCDHSAFARQFRAATSLTPSEYRRIASTVDQKKRIE